MPTATPNPPPVTRHRLAIRLPRPLWIGLATAALIVLNLLLRLTMPIYRRHVAIQEIEQTGGTVSTEFEGPEWLRIRLRDWLDFEDMKRLENVVAVRFFAAPIPETTLHRVGQLTEMQALSLENTQAT